jgi:hypothetical protein
MASSTLNNDEEFVFWNLEILLNIIQVYLASKKLTLTIF